MRRLLLTTILTLVGCQTCEPNAVDGPDAGRDVGQDGGVSDAADRDVRPADMAIEQDAGLHAGMDASEPADMALADQGMPPECDPVRGASCIVDDDCQLSRCVQGFCESRVNTCTMSQSVFDIVCAPPTAGTATYEWDVVAGASSFVVTPFVADGTIIPLRLDRPSGQVTDLQGEFSWQSFAALEEGWLNPVLVPPTGAHLHHLEAGRYAYTLTTDASEVCWYVADGVANASRLELVVYLVGLPGVTAQNAAQDPDLSAAIAHARTIYEGLGIDLSVQRYVDPLPDDVTRFRILRDLEHMRQAATMVDLEPTTVDEALRVPIVITEAYLTGFGGSPGIPGPPGLQRSRSSAVVLTGELLGTMPMGSFDPRTQDGNLVTGTILAHEVGHFLGLRHTTEFDGVRHDPLSDTAECGPPLDLNCPDVNNLMFPAAADNHTSLTTDQNDALRLSPLMR